MNSAADLYRELFEAYGPQRWWPADTVFEVIAGAVLTQNTAWYNVERALGNLKRAHALSPDAILELPADELGALLRPSGCFRVKTRRLQSVCRWLRDRGGVESIGSVPTEALRHSLLRVHGVGEETADAILLYAFGRPVFVVDAYARRLFSRLGLIEGNETYRAIRSKVQSQMGDSAIDYNEFHALIVEHGKRACLKTPRCAGCPIPDGCSFRRESGRVGGP